jgi:hypothetical protein
MRAVLGIVAGLIAGFLVIVAIGIVGVGATYSVPRGIDPYSSRQVLDLLAAMPAAPKMALLAALFAGGLAGAALAKRIVRRAWAAWTVAALIALYFLLSVGALPMPLWMQALPILATLIGGLIGDRLVRGGPLVEEPAEAA